MIAQPATVLPTTTADAPLEAALAYTARGWFVVPACWPDEDGRCACPRAATRPHDPDKEVGKAPWLPRYQDLRPTEAEVRAWWTAWPLANVAVLLKPSGLFDIAPDSPRWWKTFQERGLPRTAHAVSGGGEGHLHYFYRRPDSTPEYRLCRTGEFDVIANGVAILPPSRHRSGRRYGWLAAPDEVGALPFTPLWAVEMLRGQAPSAESGHTTPLRQAAIVDGEPPVPLTELGLERWRGELIEARDDGMVDRSDSLFEIGRVLAKAGADEADIAAAVAERDQSFGWDKYANRRDRDRRYTEIARKTFAESNVPRLGAAGESPNGTAHTAPGPFVWQTLRELVDGKPERNVQLVQGLIWSGRTHWVFGQAGTGKTLLYLCAALHVAAGRPFCGRDVDPGPVLMMQEDSPLSVIAGYVEDLADIYEIDLDAVPFWITREPGMRIVDEASYRAACDAVESAPERPSLIVLDAAEAITPADKFTPKELDPLKRFVQWCLARGITVVVIDHIRKEGGGSEKGPIDPINRLFGGLPKRAMSDVMLYLSGQIGKGGARAAFAKFRGSPPPDLDVTYDNAAGFTIRDCRRVLNPTEQKVLAVFNNARAEDGWLAPGTVYTGCPSVSKRTVQRALEHLVSERLVTQEGATSSLRYRLNVVSGGFQT